MSTVTNNIASYVQNTAYTKSASQTQTSGGNALSGDDFMMLLLAQLQHQNPLEPMDETQMMGQITQLNSLTELQKITAAIESSNKSSRLTEAAVLIGKNVTYTTKDGKTESGVCTGVSLVGGETMLYIGDKLISQSAVTSVKEVPAEDAEEEDA